MCGEFGGDAALGGAGRGGEGVGGCPEAGVAFVGVVFAGALGFAGAAAAAFSLAGWVVAAFVDFVAGPQSGAVDGGAGGEVALDGVGADDTSDPPVRHDQLQDHPRPVSQRDAMKERASRSGRVRTMLGP
ncbi:hypothetical protein, partial [Streptomyces incanus]